ncbi:MAG TPA: sugar transferase, partial [Gemmatimonadaceae bacterium]
MAKRSSLAKQHLQLTSAPGNSTPAAYGASPLRVRTKLRERRPVSVKRHTARIATRLGVLFAGDLAGILVCGLFATVAASNGMLGETVSRQFSRAISAGYGTTFSLALILIGSLVITGNYSRHRRLNGRLRLLAASSLATAVILWRLVAVQELVGAVAVFIVTTTLTWLVLLGERMATERFLTKVWPGARGAAPAVLISDRKEESIHLERAVLAEGGDYTLAGYVPVGRTTFDGVLGTVRDLPEIIDKHHVEAVVVCQHLSDQQIINVREASLAAGCQLLYPARAVKIAGVRPALVWHQDQPFFELGAPVLKASAVIVKRVVDVVGASLAIMVLSPVLILIAIAIKFDSPGSVFFAQDR